MPLFPHAARYKLTLRHYDMPIMAHIGRPCQLGSASHKGSTTLDMMGVAQASQQEPEIPGARQLVDGASAIASTSPSTIFSLALLLSTLCSRDGGRDRRTVIAALLEQLAAFDNAAAVEQSSQDAAARKAILAPAHLLAVLVTDDASARQEAAEQGELPAPLTCMLLYAGAGYRVMGRILFAHL